MNYNRLTERRETPLTMSMWAGDGKSLQLCNRLAELEDKIENGELIGRDELAKHDMKVCKEVVRECLQVLRDTRKPYPRDDYACGWNIGIGTAIERLVERYDIYEEVEE